MLSPLWTAYRQSFEGLPRIVWVLAVAGFINRVGTMVLPFVPLWVIKDLSGTEVEAGLAVTAYGVGSVFGVWIGGRLTDWGRPQGVMVVSLLGSGLTLALLGQATDVEAAACGLCILGIVSEAFRPANSAIVAAEVPESMMPRAFGLMRLAVNLGFSFGPAIGGRLAEIDYSWLFWVDACTCVLAAGWLLTMLPRKRIAGAAIQPAEKPAASPAGVSPWRDGFFLVFLAFGTLLACLLVLVMTLYPLYYHRAEGFSEARIGLLFAFNTLLIVLFEMLLMKRCERCPPLLVSAVGSVAFGLGLGLVPLAPGFAWALLAVTVWTVGEMLTGPTMTAFVGQRAPASRRGAYFAGFNLTFAVAIILAPASGAAIFASAGPVMPWLIGGGAGLFCGCGFFALHRRVGALEAATPDPGRV